MYFIHPFIRSFQTGSLVVQVAWPQSCYVSENNLELLTLFPSPFKPNHRSVPLWLANSMYFRNIFIGNIHLYFYLFKKYNKIKYNKIKQKLSHQQQKKNLREGTRIGDPLIYTLRNPVKTLNVEAIIYKLRAQCRSLRTCACCFSLCEFT